jgi:hypothetical protein
LSGPLGGCESDEVVTVSALTQGRDRWGAEQGLVIVRV